MYQVLVELNLSNNYDVYSFGIQDSEKEATKQRISELEEMIIQLRDELKEKVCTSSLFGGIICLQHSDFPLICCSTMWQCATGSLAF